MEEDTHGALAIFGESSLTLSGYFHFARERETEPWAKLICLSGTVSVVLFVLFFFQAVAYKKG